MKMDLKLDILTLNCWGIIGISRHRKERMAAIAAHIAESKYSFVFLQEIWSKDDFEMISKKTAAVLPYSHYFYSGVLGSGVCILSSSCIVDVAQFQYSLNGYAHKILHGDWFGGKVVGLCKVIHQGLKINLYVTHLHAEYDSLRDQYLAHRVAQAFEMSQFVKMTSETADLSIVAGDFNTEHHDLPYRILINNTGCSDCFFTQPNCSRDTSALCSTCGHPDNLYTGKTELSDCPTGKRIDYIMYKCGKGTSVKCLSCETPLRKIPSTSIPYSDHEAVVSKLHVFKSINEIPCEINPEVRLAAINDCHNILSQSLKDLGFNRVFYFFISCLLIAVLFMTMVIKFPCYYDIVMATLQVMSTLLLAFCLWMGTIMHKIEYSALISACKSLEILTNALVYEYGIKVPTDSHHANIHSEIIL